MPQTVPEDWDLHSPTRLTQLKGLLRNVQFKKNPSCETCATHLILGRKKTAGPIRWQNILFEKLGLVDTFDIRSLLPDLLKKI